MATHYKLPAGYTAAQICTALAVARSASPDDRFITPNGDRLTPDGYRAWFRKCLHRKINRESTAPRGRKDCPDWYWNAYRIAQHVNAPRRIVRATEIPREFRARLAHRFTTHDDY